MKRNIGTALLFALLILTIIALKQIDTPRTSTANAASSAPRVSSN